MFGGQHVCDWVHVLKMEDGERRGGREGGGAERCTPSPFPPFFTPSFIITTAQRGTVQSGSDQRAGFQPLRLGFHDNCVLLQLPWLPLLSAVVWCELQFLLAQRVTGGLQGRPCRTRALLSATGLQTLGLIQVPATHLGIAGQEL